MRTRLPKNQIHVNDSEYRFNYGHAPRGRGGWAFEFRYGPERIENPMAQDQAGPLPGDLRFVWWCPGSRLFSDAKAWAKVKAQCLGADTIVVCT